MHRDASRTLPVLWTVVLAGLVLFLALHNLSYYPPTWYDEGVHLLVARKLATEGRYLFGPALGPTVFFPVAAAFRVAGTELLPARTVMAGYLLLFVAAFYALSYQLGGWKVATVATLILISSPGTYLVRYGRQVLGEVPAALFFLLGILVWLKALEGGRGLTRFTKLVFGGLLLGLSILTKNQFVLLLPAWFLVGVAGRLYHRETRLSTTVAPVVGALVCVASWYLVQRFCFPYGERLASQNVQEWSDALDRGVLTFSPGRMLEAVKFLTSQDAIYAWALPGCAYAGVLSLRRSKAGLRWALLAVVSAVWLAWFVAFSVAWPRYAFLPLTVCTLFVAQLFHDLTDGYRAPLQDFWKTARSGRLDGGLAGRIALMVLLAVIVLRPLQGRLSEVIDGGDDTPQQMAAYIRENLSADAEIETYEPEVCFLSGYKCHFPPYEAMDASTRYVWYNGPPPSQFYDFRSHGAPYLLIGDFGRWVQLYDPEIVERDYQIEASIGGYELYRLK